MPTGITRASRMLPASCLNTHMHAHTHTHTHTHTDRQTHTYTHLTMTHPSTEIYAS